MNHYLAFMHKHIALNESFHTLIQRYKDGNNTESSRKEVILNIKGAFETLEDRELCMYKFIYKLHETFKNINYLNYNKLSMAARVEVLMSESVGFNDDDERSMLSLTRIITYLHDFNLHPRSIKPVYDYSSFYPNLNGNVSSPKSHIYDDDIDDLFFDS